MKDSASALRLFFDENLSRRIPEELRRRGYDVSWVGDDQTGAPARGTEDSAVLLFASGTGRIMATSDRGVVLICVQQRQSVIWFNTHGRQHPQLKRLEQVALVAREIDKWSRWYEEATPPVCIRVLKTRSEVITLEEATRQVNRQKRKRTVPRKGAPKLQPLGPLLRENPDSESDSHKL